MKSVILKITFLILVSCIGINIEAANKKITIDDIVYSVNTTDKRAQVKGRSDEAKKNWKLKVPDEILTEWGTIKVTSIASQAFIYDDHLTSVTLSNYIETVGSEAFFACSNLKTVNLGYSVKILGARSFSNTGVTSITFPSSLEIIRDEAFAAAESLKEAIFDRNTAKLESIGFAAFWKTALQSITIPGCVKSIGKEAFSGCTSLATVSFLSGNGKTEIGEECFTNLKKLTKVTFGNPGVETIGEGAFIGCSITEVSFPSSLRSIGNWAFSLNRIYKIDFNEGLTSIGHGSFSEQNPTMGGMTSLDQMTSLTLPSTLKSIGEKAFFYVSDDLIDVTCKATVPPTALELAFDASTQLHGVLWVAPTSVSAYMNANVWKDFQDIRGIGTSGLTDSEISATSYPVEYFSLSGERIDPDKLQPGIYIRKEGNRTKKIILNF
ncbi:MAG: leucine-rich repeat domain-containing protein [Muribaculaceae bacterium]|nr:leucine-rich repeat domain-containing protein [Muribaculaceae bacterium]